jgi:polar amino acid transport system permease protein
VTEADLARIAEYLPRLIRAAVGVTVPLALVSMALCTVFATLAAMSHHAGSRGVRTAGRIYIEVARGTPDIIQVYLWYYLLAEFGIKLPAVVAGVLALAFGHGGSLAEVVRGGIESVDRTQWDAGRVLGMRNWQIWRRVVLPQVARVILPVWTGYFVGMFKATSFLSLVAVQELMGVADEIAFFNFRYFEVFGFALFLYAIIGTAGIGLIKRVERRWSVERPRVRRDRIAEVEARVA